MSEWPLQQVRIVAGYPKSGTTWLRLFLRAYEEPEKFDINEHPEWDISDTAPSWWWRVSPIPPQHLTFPEVAALKGAVYAHIARTYPGAMVRTHWATTQVTVPSPLVEKAIYVVRDPRDVAVSLAHHRGVKMEEAAEFLANKGHCGTTPWGFPEYYGHWSDHVDSWTGAGSRAFLLLRYEDMKAKPVETFSRVVEFWKGKWNTERVEEAIRLTKFERLVEMEMDQGFVESSDKAERFFRRGVVGAWRREMPLALAVRIRKEHRAVMDRLGYLE